MKFYYLDSEDYEVGPYDEAALAQLARSGEIGRDTLVRNHMMEDDWRPACKYDFLLPALPPEEAPPPDTIPDELLRYGVFARFMVEKKAKDSSKFNYKVIPDYAGFGVRLMAFVFDAGLWVVATWLLCMFMVMIAGKQTIETAAPQPQPAAVAAADGAPADGQAPATAPAEAERTLFRATTTEQNGTITWQSSPTKTYLIPVENLSGKFAFVVFLTGFAWMIYYACSIGFFAQTLGMWYYGVLTVRPNLKEVLPFRAFCYTAAFLALGWTFIFVYFFMGMSLPERIAGVRLVRNSSRALKK